MPPRKLHVYVHQVADPTTIGLLTDIRELLAANLAQGAEVADQLSDVRANIQELGVDVDTVITEVINTRQQLADALANAGVDQAARDEIMAMIDAQQQKIADALNPAVPVDPNVPPADPGDLGGGEVPPA